MNSVAHDSDQAQLPRHVAIIMDGNGRWARSRGMPRQAGHRAGVRAVRRAVEACVRRGVSILTLTHATGRWPIGHPGEENFYFCGARSKPGQPYCEHYARMAYQAPTPKEQRRRA